eukprot:12934680-Ditylum_brightwellii.AAC.1
MSVPIIFSKLTTARKSLQKAQQNAAALCNDYLEEMAQMQVKSFFRILRSISKGQQGSAVSHILVRDNLASNSMYDEVSMGLGLQPAWVPMDDNDWVMSILLMRNKLHLHQAWKRQAHRVQSKTI